MYYESKAELLESIVRYQASLLQTSLSIIKESCGADSYEYKQIAEENKWAVQAHKDLLNVEKVKQN